MQVFSNNHCENLPYRYLNLVKFSLLQNEPEIKNSSAYSPDPLALDEQKSAKSQNQLEMNHNAMIDGRNSQK